MEYENKQNRALDLLYTALSRINHIPDERYKYIPELIGGATSDILQAVDIISDDLVEKE